MPTIEELFKAGVHLGHSRRKWHPNIKKYLFAEKQRTHIFDLEKTQKGLEKACHFLGEVAKKNGDIIFVGTKRQAQELVKKTAIDAGEMWISERWFGGLLTNFENIRSTLAKLKKKVDEKELRDKGLTKKEIKKQQKHEEKLEVFLGGIKGLEKLPDALVIIDAHREKVALTEALKVDIPVVALIDSNSDPTKITYPIPGNDDSIKSIGIILETIGDCIKEAKKGHKKSAKSKSDSK